MRNSNLTTPFGSQGLAYNKTPSINLLLYHAPPLAEAMEGVPHQPDACGTHCAIIADSYLMPNKTSLTFQTTEPLWKNRWPDHKAYIYL